MKNLLCDVKDLLVLNDFDQTKGSKTRGQIQDVQIIVIHKLSVLYVKIVLGIMKKKSTIEIANFLTV